MIPIQYDLTNPNVRNVLAEYDSFILNFKRNLDNAIRRGYIGQKIIKDEQDLTQYLSEQDIKVLTWISAHITFIANMDAGIMKRFIQYMISEWNITNGTVIHSHIHHFFVKNGYEGKKFPKDALVKAVNIDTCPYCNRNNVGLVNLSKVENGRDVIKNVKGQLDHFYNKELYPYLAISRNNLVPSCATCNEYPNKLSEDAVATNLVNPYEETNSDSLLFRINVSEDSYGSRIQNNQATITFDTSVNPNYDRNIYTFGLEELYNRFHVNKAVTIYNTFIFTYNQIYQASIENMTSDLQTTHNATFQQFKETCGVVNNKSDYKKYTLSKMITDIWNQLEQGL